MITERFTPEPKLDEAVQIRQWCEVIQNLLQIEPSKRSTCRQICEKLWAVAPCPNGYNNAAEESRKSAVKDAKGLSPNTSHGPKSPPTEKCEGPGPRGVTEDAVVAVKTSPIKPMPPHSRTTSPENRMCPLPTSESVVRPHKDILAQQRKIVQNRENVLCGRTRSRSSSPVLASKISSAKPLPLHSRTASPENRVCHESASPENVVRPERQIVQIRGKSMCERTRSRSSSPDTSVHIFSTSLEIVVKPTPFRPQSAKPQNFVQRITGLVSRLGSNAQQRTSPLSKTRTSNPRTKVDARSSLLLQPTPPLLQPTRLELTPPMRREWTQSTGRELSASPVRAQSSVSPVRRLRSAVAGERLPVDADLDETKSLTSCASRDTIDTMVCPQRKSSKSTGHLLLFSLSPPPPRLKLTRHHPRANAPSVDSHRCREVGGWGRDPFSRNFMKPTPRRKWYLTTGRRFH